MRQRIIRCMNQMQKEGSQSGALFLYLEKLLVLLGQECGGGVSSHTRHRTGGIRPVCNDIPHATVSGHPLASPSNFREKCSRKACYYTGKNNVNMLYSTVLPVKRGQVFP